MYLKFYKWLQDPHYLIGASVLRILLGLIVLYTYIVNYPLRHFFWGNSGIIDNQTYNEMNRIFFSVYGWTDSTLIFEITYHLGILITLLFTIGVGGKVIQIFNYVFTLSLFNRNGLISDGGENLLYLVLFYMLFMNVTAYFTWSNKIKTGGIFKGFKTKYKDYLSIIHNFGFIFIIVQLCTMYLLSGLYQVMGERWHSGTAIYYILQVEQYSLNLIPEFLLKNSFFIVLATYASVLIKIAFPFSLFNRYTKYIVIIGIVGFHLGILVEMGLVTFSLTMIAVDSLLITDKEYHFIAFKIKEIKRKLLKRFGRKEYERTSI
ncbi:hypothetical protein bcgnr5378_31430 [Bacillus cereus]|uniref:hypothetical protein n=1 Tax=Bacillus cereus group TaxID=86661 RepID=UPI0007782191|nr:MULTISPECIES: hypothetical protein [Bacillus cereus group]KXY98056.1 hypothetical protein AT280_28040 [Bacillus cereus]BCC45047.1 hypothetical protein BCJMU02_0356 [Bacillus cereus]HDR4617047.1 HTTM domain-containing protein [Bacillus cereus]HDR4623034.1 HTTM domain-containing protein [Bacillus cereus]